MHEPTQTSLTLLEGLRDGSSDHWDRFAQLYGPLVYEWCRRAKIPRHDAADVAQEVFRVVAKKVASFRREREGDSFRGWLWGITRHKVLDHFGQQASRPVALGGSTAHLRLQSLEEVPGNWDAALQDQDKQLLYHRALELIRAEFETHTWRAFWRVAVDGAPAAGVALELEMSVGAVYNAKYKVLKRLRREFADLMDEGEGQGRGEEMV